MMLNNWLSLAIGVAYVVLGIVVIIFKFFVIDLEPNVAYPLGALIIVYGISRIIRAITRLLEKKNEKTTNNM